MIKIDDNLLNDLGLGDLPDEERKQFLMHIYETLELRVGTTLAKQMSEQQLDEFEQIIDQSQGQDGQLDDESQAQAAQWLEQNFPSYKQVVQNELEQLKSEIKSNADTIIEQSG